jgi:hypothetical protein
LKKKELVVSNEIVEIFKKTFGKGLLGHTVYGFVELKELYQTM